MPIDIGELRGILTLQDQFSAPVEGITKKLGVFGDALKDVGMIGGAIVGSVSAVGAAVVALGNRGSAVADVSGAFEGLATKAGGADAVLKAMRDGVSGTVADFELMGAANKVLGSGLNLTADQMKTLTAGAKMLADRAGKDTPAALDALTQALVTGKNKGLVEFDMSVAKGGDVLGALRTQLAAAGGGGMDFADNIDAAKAGVSNFVDALSVSVSQSPVVAAGMDAIKVAFVDAFGGSQADLVTKLRGYVDDFAIGMTYVGQGAVIAGQALVAVWYGTKTVLEAVGTVVLGLSTGIMQLVTTAADLGSNLPGVGDKFKAWSVSAAEARDKLAGWTVSMADSTAENAKAAMGQNALTQGLTEVGVKLFDVRDSMEAARGKTVEAEAATNQFGVSQGAMAAAAQAAALKVLEYTTKLQTDLAVSQTTGLQQRLLQNQVALDQELAQNAAKEGLDEEQRLAAEELIRAHYQRKAEIILAGGDEVKEYETKLTQDLALLRADDYDKQMLELQFAEEAEIASLDKRALTNSETYDRILAKIKEFYAERRKQAETCGIDEAQIEDDSATTRLAAIEKWAQGAGRATGGVMSTQISAITTLGDAWKRFEAAKKDWAQMSASAQAQSALDVAGAAVGAMKSMWPKSKALAIASIIIDTARGAMAAYASAGNPIVGAILAALVVAAGAMQLAKVNSTNPGFRFGTPNLDYQNFSAGQAHMLHGAEAVIPRGGAGMLAHDIAGVLGDYTTGGGEIVIHTHVNLDGREVATSTARHLPRVLAAAGVGL
jgi:hypothetical protein